MTSKYNRLYPIFAEWSTLGSFVLLGDLTAQKLEHDYKPPRPPTSTAVKPTTPAISDVTHTSSLNEHTYRNEKMHQIVTAALVTDNEHNGDDDLFRVNFTRLSAAACTGLLWLAPICMLWFPFLHRFMAKYFSHLIEGSFRYVATKVILESGILAAPVCVGYFAIPAVIEGGDEWFTILTARLENDFASTLATDVSFWCVVSPINYKFIPVRCAVLLIILFVKSCNFY
jgi:hypothetical protein